jgi:hypothetical protein
VVRLAGTRECPAIVLADSAEIGEVIAFLRTLTDATAIDCMSPPALKATHERC